MPPEDSNRANTARIGSVAAEVAGFTIRVARVRGRRVFAVEGANVAFRELSEAEAHARWLREVTERHRQEGEPPAPS